MNGKVNRLYLFNNDCEMAIANRIPHYTPPRNILRMKEDLAPLMGYMAQDESYVLCTQKPSNAFIERMRAQWKIPIRFITYSELSQQTFQFVPWGIAPNVQKTMDNYNIQAYGLSWSEEIREIVNRKITISCLKLWNKLTKSSNMLPLPEVFKSCDDINYSIQNRKAVVKAPWSSSGKGVLFVENQLSAKEREWIGGILHKQQSMIVEQKWNKISDFALEYELTASGKLHYLGTSLFATGANGEYIGNVVASQAQIHRRITRYITMEVLIQTQQLVASVLSELIGQHYRGYLGVDMIIAQNEQDEYHVVPFIEINFRCNMGIIALYLSKLMRTDLAEGFFRIKHYDDSSEARRYYDNMSCNVQWDDHGKLLRGTIALTPIHHETRFVAELKVL